MRLEAACGAFSSEPTRLTRIAQIVSKESSNGDDAAKSWEHFLDWARVSLLSGSSQLSDYKVEALQGSRGSKVEI